GRLLEQRILELRDLVERNALGVAAQPKRTRVGDEMDVVAAAGELEAQLGRDCPRSTIRGITRNSDSHESCVVRGASCVVIDAHRSKTVLASISRLSAASIVQT